MGCLLDARAIVRDLTILSLDRVEDQTPHATLSVDASDDLQDWCTLVAADEIVRLRHPGQ
ncbi:MAG: DUF3999 family protein [Thiotrichales bacterium]